MSHPKYVYFFGDGKGEGSAEMRSLLGGKGANLAEMTNLGVPVPPGFTISTEICRLYYENDKHYPAGLDTQIDENLQKLEAAMGLQFGDAENPVVALCSLRCRSFNAGYDGYDSQPRFKRRHSARTYREIKQRAVCLRCLSPLCSNVRECRIRC